MHRKRWQPFLALCATISLAIGLVATPAQAATTPTATFTKSTSWDGGFTGLVTITNGGASALNGWKVEFDLPSRTSVGAYWDSLLARTGDRYSFVNREYNGAVGVGASVSFGFNGVGNGSPVNCRLNGQPCEGGAPDTEAPSVPSGLTVSGTSANTISLRWNASTDNVGVTGYEVFRGGTSVGSTPDTTFTASGLTPETDYAFTVRAKDGAGNASAQSTSVSARTGKPGTEPPPGGHVRVGYFPQWGIYERKFFIKNLDTSGAAAKLTHLNYSFANIHPTELTCFAVTKPTSSNPADPDQGTGAGDSTADYVWPFDAAQSVDGVGDGGWAGAGPLKGNFNQLRKLKAKHPNLKVLLSLGGWTYSKFFSDAARTDASRKKLVSSCVDMYIKGNLPKHYDMGGPGTGANIFDGFDLDWEWPGAEGHPGNHFGPEDKVNNSLLIEEFRRQLDALGATSGKKYLLTAFTPAAPALASAGWEMARVANSLDLFNFQGYDFHGAGSDNSWEPNRTGHHANLHTDVDDPYTTKFSVDVALKIYTDAGVDPKKLVLGVPFDGRGWQQVTDGGKKGEWQAANGAAPGDFAAEAGTRAYKNLKAQFPTVHHDEQAVAAYAFANGQWWSFDDAWVIGKKMEYVKAKGLGGAMIWSLDGDDGTLMTALDNGLR